MFAVTLRSTGGYSNLQNEAELELTLTPGVSTSHVIFPQLIPVDGVAGSDGRRDTPMVLRYAVLSGDDIDERARVLYSGLRSDAINIAESSLTAMYFSGCTSCEVGDYNGAFFEKEGTTLRTRATDRANHAGQGRQPRCGLLGERGWN